MSLKIITQRLRQHRDAILGAFSAPHCDRAASKVDILDAQSDTFHQAHPGAIKQARHQQVCALEVSEQAIDLGARHDDGHALRHLRPGHALEPRQLNRQHLAVQEQQGRQRLVLGRGADLAVDREVAQKIFDLGCAHVLGMTLAVKQDIAADPPDVRLFRAQTVVLDPDALADQVQETGSAG